VPELLFLLACHRYVHRRTKEGFRAGQGVTDTNQIEQMWSKAKEEAALVQRQSVVYSLFSRKQKNIMVSQGQSYRMARGQLVLTTWF
jgi:hypothetical protein